MMTPKDKSTLIRARLILSQKLLEESDTLPGIDGYNFSDPDNPFFHVRHEREALVVYLLLTCFDLLGQSQPHVTFIQWLNSKEPAFVEERKAAAEMLGAENGDCVDHARGMLDYYNRHHGATMAFYSGIAQLPENAIKRFLSTVEVAKRDPESLKPENKNISYNRIPIENEGKVFKLQREYLYSKRNEFTHQLSQRHFSSIPMMSSFSRNLNSTTPLPETGACWGIYVNNGKVHYGGVHQEQTDKYVYTLSDWPFALFEVLYSALGEEFDRTTIKLKFFIQIIDDGVFYPSVEHEHVSEVLKQRYGITRSILQ